MAGSYIADGITRGAGAVFWSRRASSGSRHWHVAQLPVDGLQAKLGLIADFASTAAALQAL